MFIPSIADCWSIFLVLQRYKPIWKTYSYQQTNKQEKIHKFHISLKIPCTTWGDVQESIHFPYYWRRNKGIDKWRKSRDWNKSLIARGNCGIEAKICDWFVNVIVIIKIDSIVMYKRLTEWWCSILSSCFINVS